jgi:hypothetical protein
MSARTPGGPVLNRRQQAHLNELVTNLLSTRLSLMQSAMDGPGRNLDKECGYPETPTLELYRRYYDREGLAARVVDVLPDESWSVYPELYEKDRFADTAFERDWKDLEERHAIWHYLHRIDRLSGIGQFGILFLGFKDGKDPRYPVKGVGKDGMPDGTGSKTELQFIRAYDQSKVQVKVWDTDRQSPRFGLPSVYTLQTVVDTISGAPNPGGGEAAAVYRTEDVEVHWTRVLHVADNRESSEALGTPRMQQVLNRLHDLRKLLGGSAEMFWKGAFPGYSFETHPDVEDPEVEEDTIKDQFEAYMSGLKRYMALTGMTAKSLAPQVADPTNHVVQQLTAMCASKEVPLPVFLGQMIGQLAGDQNMNTWHRRLGRRQKTYLTPMVINPLVWRLVGAGVLTAPASGRWKVAWQDLNNMTEKDKADVAVKKVQCLLQYVSSGAEVVMSAGDFLHYVLEMPVDLVEEILKRAKAAKGPDGYSTEVVWAPQPAAGPNGDPAGKTGQSGNTNALSKGRVARNEGDGGPAA